MTNEPSLSKVVICQIMLLKVADKNQYNYICAVIIKIYKNGYKNKCY